MIDELTLIKAIVGDLSGVGLWVFLGTVSYMLITKMVLYIGIGYLVKLVANKVASHLKGDLTREGVNAIESEIKNLRKEMAEIRAEDERRVIMQDANLEALKTKHKAELEDIKHMYKILKESKVEK